MPVIKEDLANVRRIAARANDSESVSQSRLSPNDCQLTGSCIPFTEAIDQSRVWRTDKGSISQVQHIWDTYGASIVNLENNSGAGVWYQSARVIIVASEFRLHESELCKGKKFSNAYHRQCHTCEQVGRSDLNGILTSVHLNSYRNIP